MAVVTRARALRAELQAAPKAAARLYLGVDDAAAGALLRGQAPLIAFLARLESVRFAPPPPASARDVVGGVEIGLEVDAQPLGEGERQRLAAELARLEEQIARAAGRLADPEFLAKAPDRVVEESRRRLSEMEERRARLSGDLGTA